MIMHKESAQTSSKKVVGLVAGLALFTLVGAGSASAAELSVEPYLECQGVESTVGFVAKLDLTATECLLIGNADGLEDWIDLVLLTVAPESASTLPLIRQALHEVRCELKSAQYGAFIVYVHAASIGKTYAHLKVTPKKMDSATPVEPLPTDRNDVKTILERLKSELGDHVHAEELAKRIAAGVERILQKLGRGVSTIDDRVSTAVEHYAVVATRMAERVESRARKAGDGVQAAISPPALRYPKRTLRRLLDRPSRALPWNW